MFSLLLIGRYLDFAASAAIRGMSIDQHFGIFPPILPEGGILFYRIKIRKKQKIMICRDGIVG
jgi:hypothetical protein